MQKNRVFKSEKLPFVELRYIAEVTSCDKKHKHKELTITALKSGDIEILFNDKTDILSSGKLSFVNPHEVHSASLTQTQSLGCYVLYLEEKWCEEITLSRIRFSLVDNKSLYELFLQTCEHLFLEEPSALEKEEKLLEFMSDVFLNYTETIPQETIHTKNRNLAYKIKEYLEVNVEDEILLADIAFSLKLSVVHIIRIFKKEFGLPIHSYILNQKVHLAKNLLSQNIPVSEVAQISGFFDQSHLNRSFKRVFQLTPKEYQNKIFS